MMGLWIAMAVLAAAAAVAVLAPIYRAGRAARPERAQALAIYRDQLDEVERDRARGVIGEAEAEAARTEIARRLIRAGGDSSDVTTEPAAAGGRARTAATVGIIAMPLAALAFYLNVGSPQMPAEPLAARLSAPVEQQDIPTLVARIEKHLADNPEDGKGWAVVAPVYMRLGRYDDAVRAYGKVVAFLGPTAERESDLGEAMVAVADGAVTPQAREVFESAAKRDPAATRPRFYLALALGQQGRTDEAIAAWNALLDGAPENQPWVNVARKELARLQGEAGAAAATAAMPGPTEADVKAAADMSPQDRLAMIEGMVAQLAAKLDENPGDGDGWARLVRSYMVLNRPDDAKAALVRGRTALAADAAALAGLDEAAKAAGVPE